MNYCQLGNGFTCYYESVLTATVTIMRIKVSKQKMYIKYIGN